MFPQRVATYAGGRVIDADLMTEYLRRVHLGFEPKEAEVRAALDLTRYLLQDRAFFTRDNAIRLSMNVVRELQPEISGLHWSLELARKPRLITSDAPLVLWRTPTFRDRFEGLGLQNAEEIRFPISPAMQLVLTPESRDPVTRYRT